MRLIRTRLIYFFIFWSLPIVSYSELPVACGALNCGGNVTQFVSSGTATLIEDGLNAIIEQQTDRAILNWQSFNVGRDNKVIFRQPDSSSTALNRIFQGVPSQILGTIEANGQVFLINNNGIVFGEGSQVNVGGLTASTLDLSDNVFLNLNVTTAITEGLPAFSGGTADDAVINFQDGSSVTVDSGQRILAIAPEVINSGELTTPNGQTILAGAQDSVYLYLADSDSDVRGLLVEVATGGSVENLGKVIAERGNITLIGQAVRQAGSLSATTSVSENGSVRLLARDGAQIDNIANPSAAFATRSGTLELAESSVTEVLPDYSSVETAAQNQEQNLSKIELAGKTIEFGRDSITRAIGGDIEVAALQNPQADLDNLPLVKTDSRILVHQGSVIDVSGDDRAVVSASNNQASIAIRANELADSPAQKDGVLQDEEIQIDIRFGTDIADVSNAISGVEKNVSERLSTGGSVNMVTDGDVVILEGAEIDISGGQVEYIEGFVETSQLLLGNQIVNISDAKKDTVYDSLSDSLKRTLVPGYVEGKDGGKLSITANDLVFQGNIIGDVVNGVYQRDTGVLSSNTPAFSRPFNQSPLSSSFIIDTTSALARDFSLLPTGQITTIIQNFNIDSVLSPDHVVQINTDILNSSNIGEFKLNTRGQFELQDNLNFREFGSFDITASDITLSDASITIHSGNVALSTDNPFFNSNSGTIVLNGRSSINTSGVLISDFSLDGNVTQALQSFDVRSINAGDISLDAEGNISLSDNSFLNASAGAFIDSNNNLTAGNAGEIKLAANLQGNQSSISGVNANRFASFGINEGGKLVIETGAIEINSSGIGPDNNILYLDDGFFSNGGFSEYELISNRNGFTIDSTAVINPRSTVFQLPSNISSFATGSELLNISSLQTLPSNLRQPTSLTFRSLQSSVGSPTLKGQANLVVEQGSSINLEAQSRLDLASDNSLFIDGAISVPSGEINLQIIDPTYIGLELGFIDSQALWLGSNAVLSVAGTSIETPNFANPLFSQVDVFDAGSINIDTARGYAVLEEGSLLDISGVSRSYLESRGIQVVTVNSYSNAGEINFNVGEGLILNSDINASANSLARSGALTIDLNRRLFVNPLDLIVGLPDLRLPLDTPRMVEISNSEAEYNFSFGDSIPDLFNGRALINISEVQESNVGLLDIKTSGTVQIVEDTQISLSRGLIFDSSELNVDNNIVTIDAPYVSLGPTIAARKSTLNESLSGVGDLSISANQLDIFGDVAIDGADEINLNIDGNIQLIGLYDSAERTTLPNGTFQYSGSLKAKADQIYTSTLSQFEIKNQDSDDGLFEVLANRQHSPVLSAGGVLTIDSPFITSSGVIRAPGGQINLNASQKIELQEGSVTSVSLEDAVVPFGRTEAGDWIYQVNDGVRSFIFEFSTLPTKNIQLNSDNVEVQGNALIDISGSGDLLAYEFIPGPSGSLDILNFELFPENYAISLINNTSYTPFDHQESRANIPPGAEIVLLDGVDGLPAGRYALFPARYAILPGFYLISKQNGFTGITKSESVQLADGSTLVGGVLAEANTAYVEDRSEGYSIISNQQLSNFAQYDTSSANSFFESSANLQARPIDAGIVSLSAAANLVFLGRIDGSSQFGNAGLIDIQSQNIAIVESDETEVDEGFLKLNANTLSSFGSQSLLIGGSRFADDGVLRLNVVSDQIQLLDNVELSVNELILAATNEINVGQGAKIQATSLNTANRSVQENIFVDGDGALLRVSTNEQVSVFRDNITGLTGSITIGEFSQITSDGSIAFDVTTNLDFFGGANATNGSIQFSAPNLILTDAPLSNQTDAVVVNTESFVNGEFSELVLQAGQSIGFKLNNFSEVDNLIIDAPSLYSADSEAGKIDSLNITSVMFKNSSNDSSSVSQDLASDLLSLNTQNISFDSAKFDFSGYQGIELNALSGVFISGENNVTTNAETFVFDSPVLDSSTGSSFNFVAKDTRLELVNTSNISSEASSNSYASNTEFLVDSFLLDTTLSHQAGEVSIYSVNDIEFGENALIDLSGVSIDFVNSIEQVSAGTLNVVSQFGSLTAAENPLLVDISGDELGSNAGVIRINVENGDFNFLGGINAQSQNANAQGEIHVVANTITNFSSFNQQLNIGDVNQGRFIRVRSGDIIVSENDNVTANNVALISDLGAINVDSGGVIRAASTNTSTSSISLSAATGITLSSGSVIDASADVGSEAKGGEIELYVSAQDATITSEVGSVITSQGSDGFNSGQLLTRFNIDTNSTATNDLASRVSLSHTGDISSYVIQPYASYTQANELVNQTDVDNAFSDVTNYINRNRPDFENSFAFDSLFYSPGLEFLGVNLSTGSNIELSNLRYIVQDPATNEILSSTPVNFVFRSENNLTINHLVADGFTSNSISDPSDPNPNFNRKLLTSNSSDIKLIAGADLASSSLTATKRNFSKFLSDEENDLISPISLNINQDVLTGTGDIDVFSSGDINLNANIYTAGINAGLGTIAPPLEVAFVGAQFGRDGGDINVTAGGNFVTEDKTQLITQWLFRWGEEDDGGNVEFPTIWGVNYDRFDQGLGALGGGDITLDVAGDVVGLNASIPTVTLHQGDFGVMGSAGNNRTFYTDDTFEVIGGGNLNATIGGNLVNAAIYIESGFAELNIGGNIGIENQPGNGLLTSLGDSQVTINALGDIYTDGIINPFLLPISEFINLLPIAGFNQITDRYWSTYTDNTSVSLSSVLGDVFYESNSAQEFTGEDLFINASGGPVSSVFKYLPGDVALKSLRGDVILSDDLILSAQPSGNLDLIAYRDIFTNATETITIGMSDRSLALQPSVTNKFEAINQLDPLLDISGNGAAFHATTPIHINDNESSKITALKGDISPRGGTLNVNMAEATNIYAGNDLLSINLTIQNNRANDVSSIQVGNNLSFPNNRDDETGRLEDDNSRIVVTGPGLLQVIAGNDINLGASFGINSSGNLLNPFLPEQGADVLLLAGVDLERSFLDSIRLGDFTSILNDFRSGTLDDRLRSSGVEGILAGDRPSFAANANLTEYQRQQSGVLVDELELIIQQNIISFAEQLTGETVGLAEAAVIYDQADQITKRRVNSEIIFNFIRTSIELATIPTLPPSDILSQADLIEENWDLGFAIIEQYFPQNGLQQGAISLFNSTVRSTAGGAINLIVPGGGIDAGLPSVVEDARRTDQLGIVTQLGGDINILAREDVAVNSSRIFAIGGGDITIWSSLGNVDAGRGAQDSLRVPPPTTTIDDNGNIVVEFSAAISGSGIGTFTTSDDDPNGSAFFGIPNGFLDAGAAGIRIAGDATFGAQEIRGTEAISIGGDSVAPGLGESGPPIALTTQADSSSAGASDSATEEAAASANEQADQSLGTSALKWLEVFILGFGDEETASYKSNECLKEDTDQVCKG